MRINATKTKYLPAGDSDHLGSSVLVDGDNLVVVNEFRYLGTIATSDNDISSEIRRRIVQGQACTKSGVFHFGKKIHGYVDDV